MKWSADVLRVATAAGRGIARLGLGGRSARAPAVAPQRSRCPIRHRHGLRRLRRSDRHHPPWQRHPATALDRARHFLMGSPEDEPERHDDEGPRQMVTLTRGLWLADSACTQALWRTVMGANPSRFTGDEQRPVERVSWDEVQGFLRALEALLHGCIIGLPTEAQWEYACRAGSDTPFSFGARITPAEVNYDGNHPYAGGEKGLFRKETVPVKSLPPNDFGLYEMHGNVWEWCADGLRRYDGQAQQDPEGPVLDGPEAHCVVRGGSWIVSPGGCVRPSAAARTAGAMRASTWAFACA
ncbi:MAG: formylglycine-generating enzyme family protein [Gammaproteobacteria bacterium]|nr:formylglycine-generating enzyme family protein [Gammaproteobacteria bacterium]